MPRYRSCPEVNELLQRLAAAQREEADALSRAVQLHLACALPEQVKVALGQHERTRAAKIQILLQLRDYEVPQQP